jgi:catechol 2,3-dioxygenase-like lactoylglutathione lyase family enzyme
MQSALEPPPSATQRHLSHSTTYRVPDRHAANAVLSARWAEFLTPPVAWNGERRAFFRDPDGHLFENSQVR